MMMMMMKRRPWAAGLQPGLEIWSPLSPCPAGAAGCPGRWRGSGSGAARSPGSGSTSTPSAGPSAGPAARRWLTWRRGTTPSWPRPLGCPRWCATRRAPPGATWNKERFVSCVKKKRVAAKSDARSRYSCFATGLCSLSRHNVRVRKEKGESQKEATSVMMPDKLQTAAVWWNYVHHLEIIWHQLATGRVESDTADKYWRPVMNGQLLVL